jgi:RNA 2',3'-cyclic 3'-phosphodiesterase
VIDGGDGAPVRAFFAIYPDEQARGDLADVAPDESDDVRVSDMADWHVTLRFLGSVAHDALPGVVAAAAAALAVVAPFDVRLGPMTALGAGAKVLFVPAEGAEHAARRLDDALGDLVEARDGPYRGHLTLARARGRGRLPSTLSGCPVSLSFHVDEVALVASRLEPERAVHQAVERFKLTGSKST